MLPLCILVGQVLLSGAADLHGFRAAVATRARSGFDFGLLRGERHEEYHLGATLPIEGWDIDAEYSYTAAKNFFDHDALGNSSIFFPLTIERVCIRAFEVTARSPQLLKRGQFYLAYSHQHAQACHTMLDVSFDKGFGRILAGCAANRKSDQQAILAGAKPAEVNERDSSQAVVFGKSFLSGRGRFLRRA